jgi:hypothetical protein
LPKRVNELLRIGVHHDLVTHKHQQKAADSGNGGDHPVDQVAAHADRRLEVGQSVYSRRLRSNAVVTPETPVTSSAAMPT